MTGKRKPYTGVLAKPLELHGPLGLARQNITWVSRVFGISVEEVKSELDKLYVQDMAEVLRRQRALFDHFGIRPDAPEAERTLALSLARRHEQAILYRDECVDLSALCVRFETTDPDEMVFKLANQHVPGFQPAAQEDWQGRLTSSELAEVFFAAFLVMDYLRQQDKRLSFRRVAEVLLDEKVLVEVVPLPAARSIQSILRRTGNKDRGSERDLESRVEYLRKAIPKGLTAWADLKSGRATDFQIQMVSEVWPTLYRLTAADAGQNGVRIEGKK